MAYAYVDGEWVWEGPYLEPTTETMEEYVEKVGTVKAVESGVVSEQRMRYLREYGTLDPFPDGDRSHTMDQPNGFQLKEVDEVAEAGLGLQAILGGAWALWQTWQAAFGDNGGTQQMANGNGGSYYGATGLVGNGGMVPVSGPGVPEPPRAMVARQWKTKAFSKTVGEYWVYFFKLIDGRIMCWNAAKGTWKMWRPKKPLAVMYRGKTTLSQAVKVQGYLDKMWKKVAKRTKALKLA